MSFIVDRNQNSACFWLELGFPNHRAMSWLTECRQMFVIPKIENGFPNFVRWAPDELNHILQQHVVDGALTTFGCVE